MWGVFLDVLKPLRTIPNSKRTAFSNVFESAMRNQIYRYFGLNNLLVPAQYDFHREMSSVAAVLDNLWQFVYKSFKEKKSSSVLLCELSLAFDCVSHGTLIAKLQKYGLRNSTSMMIESYLRRK